MPNIRIADTPQRIQYIATASQTVFAIPFPFLVNTDIVVYQNSTKLAQGGAPGQYGLSGAGTASGGTMTLVTGATVNDIITIYGATPVDRTSIYSPTVSNLTGDDLNNDFNRDIIMIKQQQTTQDFLQLQYAPYTSISQDATVTVDRWLPLLPAGGIWRKNDANTAIEAAVVPAFPVGTLGGNFTQSYRLVRTNITTGANDIEQMDVSLTTSPLTMQSTAASWYISSAVDLNLSATQNLNLKGQRWPNTIGTEGQVIGVQGGILAYLSVPSAEVPTTVDQIPMFFDTFGGIKDSPFARSGNNLLLPADPTVALAAATKQYVDNFLPVGAALTEVNDTNVTLTLGGSPSTALLRAASITVGWAGQLAETRGGTAQSTYTLGDILYASAANTLSKLAGNTTAVKQYLSQTGTGVVSAAPVWATIAGSDITGAALSKTDDTNVTMTLGGSPTTALLRAASMTLGWTGQLSATRGGSGVADPTIHGILVAQGSSPFTPIVLGAGQILIGTTSSDPVAAAIGSGSGILVGNSSGAITISNTGVLSNVATANQTTVSGATGNVTIGLASNAVLPGTGGVTLPQGNTAARAGGAGTIRFNTQTSVFESTTDGATWATIETSAIGVTSVSGTTNRITASPTTGAVVVDISASYVGQSSITTVGALTSGSLASGFTVVGLALGGTNANLTASTGGIVYSGASALAILAGTATAGQIVRSGSSAAPTWSTATYPATTTANRILYSSATNVIGEITSANSSILVTDGSGVPSLSTTIPFTVPVTTGGTGKTSFTAYAPICGGTTTTGALQSAAVGTALQIFASGGSAALPSYKTWTVTQQVFGTPGTATYTAPAGLVVAYVECIGAGGGSGGAANSVGASTVSGGGGGGEWGASWLTAATIGASQTVTVGAGGTAGTAGNNNGGTGGTSSFGALVTAIGGSAGHGAAAGTAGTPGGGGVGGTSGLSVAGESAIIGTIIATTNTMYQSSGAGCGLYGKTINGSIINAGAVKGGGSAESPGGGASGSWTSTNAGDQAGVAGANGAVIVTEYSLV